jgi:hypothetical protein
MSARSFTTYAQNDLRCADVKLDEDAAREHLEEIANVAFLRRLVRHLLAMCKQDASIVL